MDVALDPVLDQALIEKAGIASFNRQMWGAWEAADSDIVSRENFQGFENIFKV